MYRTFATKSLYALLFMSPVVLANSGFVSGCNQQAIYAISGGFELVAYCTNNAGQVEYAYLDLNICLANVNGNLVHTA
jgi:hypothetical protein